VSAPLPLDVIDVLLRVPALTPKALAARLRIAPKTGTALLRALQKRVWCGR
jgi:DNA-binding MarR family transcriptional regulator